MQVGRRRSLQRRGGAQGHRSSDPGGSLPAQTASVHWAPGRQPYPGMQPPAPGPLALLDTTGERAAGILAVLGTGRGLQSCAGVEGRVEAPPCHPVCYQGSCPLPPLP